MSILLKIGDVIIYGSQGICKIEKTETKQIGKSTAEYYVLKPIFNEATSLFVPVDNENLTHKMQTVLTKSEFCELVDRIPQIDTINTDSEDLKREQYKNSLSGGCEALVSLIKTIRFEREVRKQKGKKLNITDEQTLRKAEQLFYGIAAYILEIQPEEVKTAINF